MGFLDIGLLEVLLILVVALLIWGPGRIVETGRTLGKVIRTLRRTASDLTSMVSKEIDSEDKEHSSQSRGSSSDTTEESSEVGKTKSAGVEMDSQRDK